MMKLFNYDFKIIWKPGSKMYIADHLSRACNTQSPEPTAIAQDILNVETIYQVTMSSTKK